MTTTRAELSGFTLVEVLVALFIMTLVATLAWRTLTDMRRSVDLFKERTDMNLLFENSLTQWEADLDGLVDMPLTQPLSWDGKVLRLTRFTNGRAGDGIIVAAWTVAEREGGKHWLRWQSPPLRTYAAWYAAWSAAASWARTGEVRAADQEAAMFPVRDWALFYYREGAWVHPQSSAASVAAVNRSRSGLPEGVRLLISVDSPRNLLTDTVTRDWGRSNLAWALP